MLRIFVGVICLLVSLYLSPVTSALGVQGVTLSSSPQSDRSTSREHMLTTLISTPVILSLLNPPLDVLIDASMIEPRGRMQARKISLSAGVTRDAEFLKLFVHELAHFIDIYRLTGDSRTDPSYLFYRISWRDVSTKLAWQKQRNFVSGYAATNQYEDFAESFVFYIFHNRVFEERAMRDDIMREKYLFFQTHIFPTGVFSDTNFSLGKVPAYLWDTTRLPISLQKYLYSLN